MNTRTRAEITGEGPVLVHGATDIITPDGTTVRSDRAVTALCTCPRSRRFPRCATPATQPGTPTPGAGQA
jgi:hypothetical protein